MARYRVVVRHSDGPSYAPWEELTDEMLRDWESNLLLSLDEKESLKSPR